MEGLKEVYRFVGSFFDCIPKRNLIEPKLKSNLVGHRPLSIVN